MNHPEAVRWSEDGCAVDLLDQTVLPSRESRLRLETAEAVAEAIRTMKVRGAPAIGIAAAMGLAVEAVRSVREGAEGAELDRRVAVAAERLRSTRPTAVNLGWALDRLLARWRASVQSPAPDRAQVLMAEATAILEEDRAMCRRIGEHGAPLLPTDGCAVLTHCNAGALATGGMGTALAPIYRAVEEGRRVRVFVDETRPLLQGSRLTAWELGRAGVDVTLVTDSTAAFLMAQGKVDAVVVGADRIAANGDVANKIGTYGLAVLAREHGVPFYVAAPSSTLDPATPDGGAIPIEERDPDEVRRGFGQATAPAEVRVYAPAFDVTPARLVTAIVTDQGVLRPPYDASIRSVAGERE